MRRFPLPIAGLLALAACAPDAPAVDASLPPVEAISLLGDSLRRPVLSNEARTRMEAQLDSAEQAWTADNSSADALIWLGRRTAYLGRYGEAIGIFTRGIERWPDDARFYRHRGHRYITTRQFDLAAADFERARALVTGQQDEVEPDGQPNARNIPTSTLQSNIYYHLALVYYLRGEFERVIEVYADPQARATNPDMLVANSHWLYMSLRRLGRDREAAQVLEPIGLDTEVIENGAYLRLLQMYKGLLSPDSLVVGGDGDAALQDATTGYGFGNWHLYNGRPAEAESVFRRIVASGPWASFGFIAAEAELLRGQIR